MVSEVEYNAKAFLRGKSDSLKKLVWGPMAPRQAVLEPWLERGSAALVWGPTGVGKSYFAQSIALAVATGGALPNIAWRAAGEGMKVLWFDGEQGLRTAQARSRQLLTGGTEGRSPVEVSSAVLEAAEQGELDRNLDYRNKVVRPDHCPDIGKAQNRAMIEKVVKDGQFDLVIFDNIMVLATVESWDDAAALADLSSWFNYMAKLVMHHAKKDGSSYNGSARIGQDFEVIASLQPLDLRIPWTFGQSGPAFTLEFLKMRDQPPGWNNDPINMILCQDAWRTFDREDLGYRSHGMKVTDAEIKHHWSSGEFPQLKFLARHLGVSEETLRKRSRALGLPRWRSRTNGHQGAGGANRTNGSSHVAENETEDF